MGIFTRRTQRPVASPELASFDDIAYFGRTTFLKEASGIDLGAVGSPLDFVRTLFEGLYGENTRRRAVIDELHRLSGGGVWPAFGAWRFCVEFLDQEPEAWSSIETAGVHALVQMRISNLDMTLSPNDMDAYERVMGERPRGNGLFMPPVFESDFGPTLDYYARSAAAASMSRHPVRVLEARGASPTHVPPLTDALWEFARILYLGPLIVGHGAQDEVTILREVMEAAYGVDHEAFAETLLQQVATAMKDNPTGWPALGAARFIEDYLDPRVTGSDVHQALLSTASEWLSAPRAHSIRVTAVPVMSPIERASWAARALHGGETREE